MPISFPKINDVFVYLGHGIIHRDLILSIAEVSFRVRYGAPHVRSLRNFKVNLYRRTPLRLFLFFLLPSLVVTQILGCIAFLRRSTIIEVHPNFSEALPLRGSIPHPKPDFSKNQNCIAANNPIARV